MEIEWAEEMNMEASVNSRLCAGQAGMCTYLVCTYICISGL